MSSSTERWPSIEAALRVLGAGDRSGDLRRIRARFDEIAGQGHYLMPDFILHEVTHSDNLILILARLKDTFGLKLGPYETYLLAASVYLHDLGMFFSETRFLREISPDPHTALSFCPHDACDLIDYDRVQRRPLGEQIRLTHNVLSARWLADVEPATFGLESRDVPYVITIVRGHQKADLRSTGCGCYQAIPVDGQRLRLGLLAGLLRLADALDFYQNRAPAVAFKHRVLDFLSNPTALEYWIKHYFVTDSYVTRRDEGGTVWLECHLHMTVPMKTLNGVPYRDFFHPLFEAHVAEAQSNDLDCHLYPSELMMALGITHLEFRLVERVQLGFRDLPVELVDEIRRSGSRDVMAFLEWLRNPPRQWYEPPLLNRYEEQETFRAMLRGQRVERLMLVAGEAGQGKSYLLRGFEVIAAEEGAPCLYLSLEEPDLDPATLLDRLADWPDRLTDCQDRTHFATYKAARFEVAGLSLPDNAEEQASRQRTLTEAFFTDAPGVFPTTIALLLDSYERAGYMLQTWLEAEFLVRWTQTTGSVVVVAGRQVPDLPFDQICLYTLTGLELHEWRNCAQFMGLYLSEEVLSTLHILFDGIPLYMVTNLRKLTLTGGGR